MQSRQVSNSLMNSAPVFFVRLAWRNLWRNRKRTLIASGSVFFAVFLAILTYAMKAGQFEYMVYSAVSFSTGHIQIHGEEYWEKRSLDQSMKLDSSQIDRARSLPHVRAVVPRLQTVALVSHNAASRVSPVIGIDPKNEDAMTGLGKRIVRGTPIAQWRDGAVLAEGLARLLQVDVGDSIVVYGQGYEGVTAAAVIRVAGIVQFPIVDINNAMLYLPLSRAQDLFSAAGRVTAVSVLLDNDNALEKSAASLRTIFDGRHEVMTWREMLPELLQAIAVSKSATMIMLLILYLVIGFGIFGTIMMMTAERTREFGITVALGMRRRRLMAVTAIESIFMSMLGAVVGIAASIPLVLELHWHPIRLGGDYARAMLAYGMEPILPISIDPMVFIIQGLVVFALGVISASYPILILNKLEPVRAMRG